MQMERALRLLDTLDSMAYALRLAWAGYWGRRLRAACLASLLLLGLAGVPLPGLVG